MRSTSVRVAFLTALLIALSASSDTQTSARSRIAGRIDDANVAVVRGTAHPLAQARFDRGRTPIDRITQGAITFRLSAAQQADLDQLLREQQDRSSPNYHRWLTPDQYASRFGMSQSDLAKVTAWLKSQGLTVENISRNRNEILFRGTVGEVEYALKTDIHDYSINGEEHFANATDISLPTAFSSEVLGVRGLNNFHPKPRFHVAGPRFTSSISGNHFLIPGDFATIYNVPSNVDGTGQAIAVIGQTLINTSDIDSFRSAAGLPARTAANFQQIQASGTGTAIHCAGDETEADLDLEWSQGVAKNATIKYVYAGLGTGTNCGNKTGGRTKNAFDALLFAINNNVAPIVSISYGNCEANLTSFLPTMQQWAQQANSQGQTISGPSGDDGAADCDNNVTSATNGLVVDVPASIPEVTGVGGTEFTGDSSQCPSTPPNPPSCPGGVAPADPPYWNGSSSPTSGASALTYIPEKTWNDGVVSGGFSAGGGGASKVFSKPSWQTGTGVPNDGKRDVPDIALSGSSLHDPYLICSQDAFDSATPPVNLTSCTTGFRASDGQALQGIGGTSAGAPTFAGILALINQATGSNGLGNVNPMLYQLANTNGVFHDIATGDNKVPCTAGSKNCPNGTTSIGFAAGNGYDQVTGLGSPNVTNLINAWVAASVSPDFSLEGLVSTASAPGAQGTSTISVTALNGFSQTVSLTCAPANTSVHISCSLNPASVDLSAGRIQTSALTITTAADLRLPSGQRPRGLWIATGGGMFAAVILGSVPSRRRRFLMLGLGLLALALALSCGGGGGGGGSGGNNGTPAGTYIVTVTGTSGATSHIANISFTVQ
jgi:subtilase family serine protease